MSYQYLLWDMDGTILDFDAAERAAIRTLFEKYGFGICTDEMLERYAAINRRYWQALERGEMTKPEILVGRFAEFFRTEGLDESKAADFNADYQLTLGETIVFRDDAKNILLSEKGRYTLVMITNGTKTAQDKKLARSGLGEVFDYIFISEVVGCEKPGKAFFDHVFEKVGITDLSRVLVIGDSLTSDIRGGMNAGVDTCWYNPAGKENTSEVMPTYVIRNLHEVEGLL